MNFSLNHYFVNILLAMVLILFAFTTIHNAWLCDDAFITFRTVDNFNHGYGLTWNISERVQTYTHPLWMILLAITNFFTGEFYYTSLILSISFSFAALIWILLLAKNHAVTILALSILLFSKAYMDYTTSGLENPVSHFLVGAFVFLVVNRSLIPRPLFWLSLLAALGCITRSDLLLLFAPFLLWLLWQNRNLKSLLWIIVGFFPLFLWQAFSLFYYGSPVPNTAYAKLIAIHIPRSELWLQGGYYFLDSIQSDPITLLTIAFATIWVWIRRTEIEFRLLSLGSILYLLYIVWIGGDFMSGRFFTLPLFASILILIRTCNIATGPKWLISLAVVWLFGMFTPDPPLLSHSLYGTNPQNLSNEHFIFNERAHYFQKTGLFALSRWNFHPETVDRTPPPGFDEHIPIRPEVRVGVKGYKYGPYIHVLDCLALGDPLLSRLPSLLPWEIAHFYRHIPAGYLESLQTDSNRLQDLNLNQFYEKLRLITRGDLGSFQRIIEIIKMNLGWYDHLIDVQYYQHPPRKQIHISKVNQIPDPYRNWYDDRNLHFPNTGLEIHWIELVFPKELQISLDKFSDYKIRFYQNEQSLGESILDTSHAATEVSIWTVSVPESVMEQGMNRILLEPIQANSRCTLGHIRIREM